MAILSREFKPEPDSELFDPETGKCSIEYYNACKDPYRVAAHNKIPVPWPLKESGASICGEVFGQLEEQIRGVLGSFGITTHDICVHCRAGCGGRSTEMRVEIRNEEKMYKDVSHIIRDHDTVETLKKVQPLVLAATVEFCSGKWSSIAYHNRGLAPRDSEKKVSVVVFVKPGSVDAWGVFQKIMDVIESAISLEDADIYVEIQPGHIMLC
ncbi:hypothetical protein V494_08147 [Pseudogymnoascus sp. VKM F-4513 (FW-928)]|nr:hypothetical protein V494_08147 [Pseudogymnoascus sp. VKM F-4513 (FW-928)]